VGAYNGRGRRGISAMNAVGCRIDTRHPHRRRGIPHRRCGIRIDAVAFRIDAAGFL